MKNIQANQIIGALVASDYRTASVFKKYGIDFCCQGKRSIQAACDTGNLSSAEVVEELNRVSSDLAEPALDYKTWPLDLLVDYIEKIHHRYVEEKIAEIQPYLDKVCRVHGERHPELLSISRHFNEASNALRQHMKNEEQYVFPFVRSMGNIQESGKLTESIQVMIREHSNEGERFAQIAKLSNNYTPPVGACVTYRVLFELLKEFENNLHLHIHLENNIVFPQLLQRPMKA